MKVTIIKCADEYAIYKDGVFVHSYVSSHDVSLWLEKLGIEVTVYDRFALIPHMSFRDHQYPDRLEDIEPKILAAIEEKRRREISQLEDRLRKLREEQS